MKRLLIFPISLLLAGAVTMVSCSDDSEGIPGEVPAAPMNDYMQTFFEQVPKSVTSYDDVFQLGFRRSDTCYVINSKEEFVALYRGTNVLPEIDFGKYSLIVGGKTSPVASGLDRSRQVLIEKEDCYNLNLFRARIDERKTMITASVRFFYYGIYPKLNEKRMVVNLYE